jgi:predicted dehydrogenase/nucleoside-diphosphate-sugar epimerase
MRVAIVGAGNNSDYHVRFAKAYPGAMIVGIADTDLPRAEEVARAHGIERAFPSTAAMLEQSRPDVVHVVTPPMTHFAVVREVLEAGCHVLVEKPLTLDAAEARTLYELAERRQVQLCPVHNHLFDPCMQRADEMIKAGALGRVIHVESHYGLNTDIPAFRDYPRPNVLPWLYRLPGGVYQDFLPHAIYPVLEYTGAPRNITVMHRATGTLPQSLPDEIRILVDGERAFGTIVVSFAAKPHLQFIRVFGTEGMVEVDINTMTTTVHAVSGLPKAAQKATYNLEDSWQKARSTVKNVLQFVTGKLKPYQGMQVLIHAFYAAIEHGGPIPVPKSRALDVLDTMDAVFQQLKYEPLTHEPLLGAAAGPYARKVLVTGGTGFLGKAVVKRFLAEGYAVRVLARKLSRVDAVNELGAEVFWGDVADLESFGEAFAGCDIVVHLAAGTSGSEKDSETATLQGTRNLIELSRRYKPARVVYISSCSVYGIVDCDPRVPIAEAAPLERFPERRGRYSASKQEAEQLVRAYMQSRDVPVVVLRPGAIYGPGSDLFTGMMGFSAGPIYVVLGTGSFVLPLVYVDNVADAIAVCASRDEAPGEIFNLLDSEGVTKREYMKRVVKRANPSARVLYLPLTVFYALTWFQEIAFGLMKRRPVLTRYRVASSQKKVHFDGSRIARCLSWRPPVSTTEGLERLVTADLGTHGRTSALGSTPPPKAAAANGTLGTSISSTGRL